MRNFYSSFLAMPIEAASRICTWKFELAICYRAILLGQALDSASERYCMILSHLSDVTRARSRVFDCAATAASGPVYYCDRAMDETVKAAFELRNKLDCVVALLETLIDDVARVADDSARLAEQYPGHPDLTRDEKFKSECYNELKRRVQTICDGNDDGLKKLSNASWPQYPA